MLLALLSNITCIRTPTQRAGLARTGVGGVLLGSRNTLYKKRLVSIKIVHAMKRLIYVLKSKLCKKDKWFISVKTIFFVSVLIETIYGPLFKAYTKIIFWKFWFWSSRFFYRAFFIPFVYVCIHKQLCLYN
jgi:hypothetical protein